MNKVIGKYSLRWANDYIEVSKCTRIEDDGSCWYEHIFFLGPYESYDEVPYDITEAQLDLYLTFS